MLLRSMRLDRLLFFLFALAGIHSEGFAEPKKLDAAAALHALEMVANAGRSLNFSGTFVRQKAGSVETSEITHFVDGRRELEKVERLDGVPFELVRTNDEVLIYLPSEKFLRSRSNVKDRSFPAITKEQLATVSEFYDVFLGDVDRVAGRFAVKVILEPKDDLRFRHELWIDQKTSLQLKAQMINDRGEIAEQIMFTQIAVGGDITAEDCASRYAEEALTWRMDKRARQKVSNGSPNWHVSAYPPGYRKVLEMHKQINAGGNEQTHLVFTDGFAAVSIFIENRKKRGFRAGLSKEGALNVYRRVVDGDFVTVIGDAPVSAITLIGDSVVSSR